MTDQPSYFVCHKCGGLLTPCTDPRLYGCGCISGYIRDWQNSITIEQVRQEQIAACVDRLDLYRYQRRSDRSGHVLDARTDLAMLLNPD